MNTTLKFIMIFSGIIVLLTGMMYGIAYLGGYDIKKANENASVEVAIPPIDLADPSTVEVATFALG